MEHVDVAEALVKAHSNGTHTNGNGYSHLPDIQQTQDVRNKPIDRVGIAGAKLPMFLKDGQQVLVTLDAYTALPHNFKGTHMSRFVQALPEMSNKIINKETIETYLRRLSGLLNSNDCYVKLQFDYLYEKISPVTKIGGSYQQGTVSLIGLLDSSKLFDSYTLIYRLEVSTASLCPCSKEMSLQGDGVGKGAHNQRSVIRCDFILPEFPDVLGREDVDITEMFRDIESCGSVSLYPLLKRPDEKYVTEAAYENPKFVEDIVRDVALMLDNWGCDAYSLKVENFESIHQHNAIAYLKTPNWSHHI